MRNSIGKIIKYFVISVVSLFTIMPIITFSQGSSLNITPPPSSGSNTNNFVNPTSSYVDDSEQIHQQIRRTK